MLLTFLIPLQKKHAYQIAWGKWSEMKESLVKFVSLWRAWIIIPLTHRKAYRVWLSFIGRLVVS